MFAAVSTDATLDVTVPLVRHERHMVGKERADRNKSAQRHHDASSTIHRQSHAEIQDIARTPPGDSRAVTIAVQARS